MALQGYWAQKFKTQQSQLAKNKPGAFGPPNQPFANPNFVGGASQGQAFPGFGGASGNPFALFQNIPKQGLPGGQPQQPPPNPFMGPGTMLGSGDINQYNKQYNRWLQQQQMAQPPSLMQQFMVGLGQDVNNQNLSNQMQFQGGQALQGQMAGLLGGMQQNLINPAMQNAQAVQQMGAQMQQLGNDQVTGWRELYDRNRGDLLNSLGAANAQADQAVSDFEAARAGYKDMSAQTVSAMVGGMASDIANRQRDMQNQLMQAQTMGDQAGAAMAQEGLYRMKQEWGAQRQQLATQVLSEQNQVMARLTQDIGNARMQSAGMKASNAAIQGQFDNAGQGQLLQAHQAQMQAHQIAADLSMWSANHQAQIQLSALDKQMQGLMFSGQLLQQFPYSPVSMVDIIMAGATMQQAGAQNKPGLQFPKQGQQMSPFMYA